MFKTFLDPEGHQNPICGSKGMAILLKWLLLPISGVALGSLVLYITRVNPNYQLITCLHWGISKTTKEYNYAFKIPFWFTLIFDNLIYCLAFMV